MFFFYSILIAIFGGLGCNWVSGKSRGKNARNAFRYAAWGFWLAPLYFLSAPLSLLLPFPFISLILAMIVMLTPSVICFWLAATSMLKEMRAQKVGAYTERA